MIGLYVELPSKPQPIGTDQGGKSVTIYGSTGAVQSQTFGMSAIGGGMLAKLTTIGYSSLKSNLIIAITNVFKTSGLAFANLPSWVKTGLVFIGVESMADWFSEESAASNLLPSDKGLWVYDPDLNPHIYTQQESVSSSQFEIAQVKRGQPMMTTTPTPFRIGQPFEASGLTILKTWIANGMVHFLLSGGWRAVQRKDLSYKLFRPKKIKAVLYSDGAKDLPTTLRAAKILKKQAKDMRKVVDFFYPSKTTKKVPANVINVETGAGSLIAK